MKTKLTTRPGFLHEQASLTDSWAETGAATDALLAQQKREVTCDI
jgi:hypothetical protein